MATELAKKVEERKKGRIAAGDVIELLTAWTSSASEDYEDSFWETVRKAFPTRLAKPEPPAMEVKSMPDKEAVMFEYEKVPYGIHVGKQLYQVDADYLEWLAEAKEDEFKLNLRRYLKSDRYKELRKRT